MGVDEETFLQHIKDLNIDCGGVSFGWLLEEDNEILNWFYNNIHSNNCITAEEKALYTELENAGDVLDELEVKSELNEILKKYDGIALPTESRSIQDAKQKVEDLQEWIDLIEEQHQTKDQLFARNEEINRHLSKEQHALNEKLSIEKTVLAKLTDECQELVLKAKNEKLKCFNVVEDVLKTCAASKNSDEKLFFSQMPLEDYLGKTDLLVTYLKYYVSKQVEYFSNSDDALGQGDSLALKYGTGKLNDDAKLAESKLKEICDKLKGGLCFYVKTKADLNGALEQLKFIQEYDVESCYDTNFERVKYTGLTKVLDTEIETYQLQKVPEAIQQFVDCQSEQVLLGELQLRYEKSKHIYDQFCYVTTMSQEAVNECDVAIMCLKRDQLTAQDLFRFSMDVMQCLQTEMAAKKSRKIIPRPLTDGNFLLKSLYSLFKIDDSFSVLELCKSMERLQADIEYLEKEAFYEKFDITNDIMKESVSAMSSIKALIWNGPTDQPIICNTELDSALYEIRKGNERGENRIQMIAKAYMDFKKLMDQESVMNNLWKWFMCDSAKIQAIREKFRHRESRSTKPFK